MPRGELLTQVWARYKRLGIEARVIFGIVAALLLGLVGAMLISVWQYLLCPFAVILTAGITANQVVNIFGHRLQYTTDTQPGSSGSPVLNDEWKAVALHHSGGNLPKNARGDRMYANEGILFSAICREL